MAASNSCTAENVWWISIAASSGLYVLGIAITLFIVVINARLPLSNTCLHRIRKLLKNIKQICQKATSVDDSLGRFMIVLHICCNVAYCSLVVYRLYQPVIRCFDESLPVDIIIELVISSALTLYFFIHFLSASNVAKFLVQPYTIIDFFTIPTVFVACALYKDWVDLRPLRFLWLIQISDILRFSHRIRSTFVVDIVSILLRFVCIWLTASGIISVLETTGDPSSDFMNAQSVTFCEYTYYIMVTMSTVGYGDYLPKTAWGQTFITFFISSFVSAFSDAYSDTDWISRCIRSPFSSSPSVPVV